MNVAETIWIRGENGALYEFSAPLHESVLDRLGRGDLVRVSKDGSPWHEAGDAEPEDVPPPDAPELPKRAASRAVWQKFAVSQGMDSHKAAAMTRDDLVEEFTREHGES